MGLGGKSNVWKRWFETSKIMSVRMLGSYLAILAAPLAAIIIFYMYASNAMLNVQCEKSYSLLTESVTSFERQLSEVQNVSRHLMENPSVLQFVRGYDTKQDEFWDKYRFAQTQPEYSLTNQIVDSVYVLIRDSAYIVKLPAVVPASTLGFHSVNEFAIDSYEELLEQFCGTWNYGKIYWLKDEQKLEQMAVVHSISEDRPVKGAIVVTLNRSAVNDVLEDCNPYAASATFILDGSGKVLKDVSGFEAEITAEMLAKQIYENQGQEMDCVLDRKSGYQTIKIEGTEYLVCWKYSSQQDWLYASATPISVLTQQIQEMRVWMVIMMVIALMISIVICIYYWAKRRVIIKQYYDLRGEIKDAKPVRPNFLSAVRDLIDQVENLRATLSLQENLVRTSVLRKLLYGEYAQQGELLSQLKHAGLEFPGKMCYAAVWSFDRILENGTFRDMTEFRTYIRGWIEKHVLFHHYLYEVNYNMLAVIFSDPSLTSLLDIRNMFLECNNQLKEQVCIDGYTGVAEGVTDLLELAACFAEAKEACEYAGYYRLATPIPGISTPEIAMNPFFSSDLEKRFETAIKENGNEMIRNLFDEIYSVIEEQKPGQQMANHYMNFVRSAAMKTLTEYCVEEEMLTKVSLISESDSWRSLFSRILDAKRTIHALVAEQTDTQMEPVKREIMEIMREKYADAEFGLAVLAEKYGVSESKMYKDFRLYFGKSFAEMLETVRMEKACELLKGGTSVKDVTALTGYSSDTSFRRAFKRVTGMTPTEYCQNNGR